MGLFDAVRNYTEVATANLSRVYDGIHATYDTARFNAAVSVAKAQSTSGNMVTSFEGASRNIVENLQTYSEKVGAGVAGAATTASKRITQLGSRTVGVIDNYNEQIGRSVSKSASSALSGIMSDTAMKVVIAGGAIYLASQVLKSGKAQRWLA